ncbi:Trans-aconitate 2-methyltransferase [Alphaproteobacteria bacterium SO-S41]|nr:Trans-aconitate 2-methyltransferase [Alphaproteobacteria bacterium SO-S41]
MTLEGWPDDPVAAAADLIEEGRAAEAAARLSALIGDGRGGLLARLTLVRALLAEGRHEDAVAAARELTQLAPSWAEAAVAFGRALAANGALPVAIAEYQRALRLDRDCAPAEIALAEAWAEAGEVEKAEAHLDAAEALGAAVTGLRARLDAMRGAARSDAGYVRHLFDQFAVDYDERMRGNLGYRAPEILRDLGVMVAGKLKKAPTLDLGCGTGLAAPVFKPFATKLTGVDLSPQMIAQAKTGRLYDALEVGDIESWLAETKARFGRVIAADVLVYLGDLAKVFAGVRRVLKPGGFFLFTVERHEGVEDFLLQETRRWAHRRGYVETLAAAEGFDLRGLVECTPRFNKGVAIPGLAGALAVP